MAMANNDYMGIGVRGGVATHMPMIS